MFLLLGERAFEGSWALTALALGEVAAHRSCGTEADIQSFFL